MPNLIPKPSPACQRTTIVVVVCQSCVASSVYSNSLPLSDLSEMAGTDLYCICHPLVSSLAPPTNDSFDLSGTSDLSSSTHWWQQPLAPPTCDINVTNSTHMVDDLLLPYQHICSVQQLHNDIIYKNACVHCVYCAGQVWKCMDLHTAIANHRTLS